jgi:ribosomal protein S12 methylthiotransferase accessory factor
MIDELLVDRRTGLLVDVDRLPTPPGMPACWVSYGAMVGRADRFASWRADSYGFGASLGDEDAARGAAIGEAVERYCGNAVPDDLLRASYDDLVGTGADAVDPTTLALYSERQYGTSGFPFVPFTRDLPVRWVPGTDLHTDYAVWVPASLAYLDFIHGARADEPATHSLMYSGIATGTDLRAADRAALEELLERDATTIWWAGSSAAPGLDDGGRVVGQLGRPPRTGGDLSINLTAVPSEFDVPVVAVLVEDPATATVGFGSACRADPARAATKALVEALGVLRLARDLDDPSSTVWASVRTGQVERHVYLPHRPDRRYLELAGPDWRHLTDLPPVAQVYLDPRMQGRRLDRLRPAQRVPLADRPVVDHRRDREVYLERIAAAGLRAVRVELTTPDVAAAGLRVVRVIVPGLLGNGPPAFPLRGGHRLHAPGRPVEDDLVTDPLPLA